MPSLCNLAIFHIRSRRINSSSQLTTTSSNARYSNSWQNRIVRWLNSILKKGFDASRMWMPRQTTVYKSGRRRLASRHVSVCSVLLVLRAYAPKLPLISVIKNRLWFGIPPIFHHWPKLDYLRRDAESKRYDPVRKCWLFGKPYNICRFINSSK